LDTDAVAAAVFADEEDLARAAALEGVGDALGGVFPDIGGAGDEGASGEGLFLNPQAFAPELFWTVRG
jgi:hypothetical protein